MVGKEVFLAVLKAALSNKVTYLLPLPNDVEVKNLIIRAIDLDTLVEDSSEVLNKSIAYLYLLCYCLIK